MSLPFGNSRGKARLRAAVVRGARIGLSEQSVRLDHLAGQLAELAREVRDLADAQARSTGESKERLQHLTSELKELGEKVTRNRQIASSILDDIPALRRELRSARAGADYERAFSDPEPLVSIRIATYNNAELLVERAIASVLAQTYENTEIVVVGDGCTDDTQARVAAMADPRIRFVNLPFRWPYPEDPGHRWLVAGSPAMNVAAQLARGQWIAPLDDDDEFVPDHVESLLTAARANEFEMMYGQIQLRSPDGLMDERPCTYPPAYAHFGFQASVYMGELRFFEYNPRSWMLDESGDWNLCRRMLEAGVRIGFLDKVVTEYYPARLWGAGGGAR
jgi:hypothetical protein